MTIEAIKIIQQYRQECLFAPKENWPDDEFKKRSYSRWAVNEILSRLESNLKADPVEVITNFIFVMDKYSCIDKVGNPDLMFLEAKNVAEELLYLLQNNACKGVETNEQRTSSKYRKESN